MFGRTKHQNWFSGKRFPRQPNSGKHFPFPEISISGKYVFSGNRFTATKRTLKYLPVQFNYSENGNQWFEKAFVRQTDRDTKI